MKAFHNLLEYIHPDFLRMKFSDEALTIKNSFESAYYQ